MSKVIQTRAGEAASGPSYLMCSLHIVVVLLKTHRFPASNSAMNFAFHYNKVRVLPITYGF